MKVHLITHTHWDREWYRTYQEFRIYLVNLIDNLIEWLDTHEEYHSFLLDGQTVVLEDYLQVRPEQYDKLKRQIEMGKIIIGPMYIQPDEYIPSGESLVRNLLIGNLICERFGAIMKIGYFPDSFGQASQIPQILKGFGIDKAVFWRGLCDEDIKETEFIWESRDGSKVLTLWLPFSYGSGYIMPTDPEGAIIFVKKAAQYLGSMATANNMVLMRGWDHSGFSPEVTEILAGISEPLQNEGIEIVHSSLQNLFMDIEKEKPDLKTLQGEFRKPKTMRIHAGIDSTRMDIKQLNRKNQNLLEKYVEPLCAINWILGDSYPGQVINQAWKYILQSQAHDSICSCCTDDALRTVKNRFLDAYEIESALLGNATASLAQKIRTNHIEGIPLVVLNSIPFDRSEAVQAEAVIQFDDFILRSNDGARIPCQVIRSEKVNLGVDPSMEALRASKEEGKKDLLKEVGRRPDDPAIYYSQDQYVPLSLRAEGIKGKRVTFQFPVKDLPACGSEVVYLQKGKIEEKTVTDLVTGKNTLENKFLRVEFNSNGSFDLTDKGTGITYKNCGFFQDSGDAGDEYNYSPPEKDEIITSEKKQANIEILDKGPYLGRFKIGIYLDVPSGLSEDGKRRSSEKQEMFIESEVSLYSGSKILRIHTTIHNDADDHRVRVLFPCGLKTECSYAEEQFGVIRRPNVLEQEKYWKEEGWVEQPLPIYPQQTFVDINDGNRGLAILNRNLTEYEIIGEEESIIAVTLFRGVGAMGRPDLVIRPGRASGIEISTPDALMHGELEFEYAVFPHSGNFDDVAYYATLYNAPVKIVQIDQHEGIDMQTKALVRIEPNNLIPTCLKKAERENALILRMFNSASGPIQDGKLWLSDRFERAYVVNLNEQLIDKSELKFDGTCWNLPKLVSSQILTIKLIPNSSDNG